MSNNSKLWTLTGDGSWLAGQEFAVSASPIEIGRGNQCGIVIPGKHLSRKHAQLSVTEQGLHIKDLNSANGTFINGKAVTEGLLKNGDKLRLDVCSFIVSAPQGHTSQPSSEPKTKFRQGQAGSQENPAKRWKTKATSPGNRHPTTVGKGHSWTPWINAIILALTAALVVWLLAL